MVRRELARREEASANHNPFCFIVSDEPAAMTDAAEAAKAIAAQTEAGNLTDRVTVTYAIKDAVRAALSAAHPRRFKTGEIGIMMRTIVDSKRRHEAVPDALEDGPPSPGGTPVPARADEDEVMQRAAERLHQMRDGQF